ncbi:MAG: glycoside hydrolase family 140 protein [Cytophagales bacterium]|nr:glycoside hydrolase family 140 protein [Armatimonadota bacterium]
MTSRTQRLRVSENQRYLVHEDGTPFFYLGDTAWELFHRLNREEAQHYLADRAAKGFTVIQAVVLAELDGLQTPNANGDLPLWDLDPTRPNEDYFAHVDWVVEKAASLGLFIGMLPTWGDKWNKGTWGAGPELFTPENARAYGAFLGARYRDAPLIWILGGDRNVETEQHRAVLRAMAEGVTDGDGGAHLRTLHPPGGQSSARFFPDDDWLDFHLWQSGHGRNAANYDRISETYALSPPKPCLDSEPGYEDHPAGFDLNNGHLDDYDCRKALYWALFAGACGHTYGCHDLWQMASPLRAAISSARRPWYEAIHLPGAGQMRHAGALLLSRPYLSRVPDQSLIVSPVGEGTDHVQATRDADGSYALVYVPTYKTVTVDLSRLSGSPLDAWWFDPRSGLAQPIAGDLLAADGPREFTHPSGGLDWVLVLDDAAKSYGVPGQR